VRPTLLNSVTPGTDSPNHFNVIIEIPSNSQPVKYEVDKATGVMFVDRFMATSMRYPCEYGYIPQTLSEDGDPVDVCVISPLPLISGSLIVVRPVGVLKMTDEAGVDAKVLAVPISKLTSMYSHMRDIEDIDTFTKDKIAHFFEHYKDLESGKWVKIDGWYNVEAANTEILQSIKRYNSSI